MIPPTVTMLYDLLCQCIRLGFVTARQPEKMRLQVEIKDSPGGRLVTKFLPMLTPRARGDMQYDLPDIGDQVLVLFLPYGLEQGFVLGAMYGGNNPPTTNADVWHRTFSDGTVLEYDRGVHKLKADVKGELEAKATGVAALTSEQHIELKAPKIFLRGTLVSTSTDGGAGDTVISGNVRILDGGAEVAADVVASGVSLVSHLHSGVQSGNSSTGTPLGGGSGQETAPAISNPVVNPSCTLQEQKKAVMECLPKIALANADASLRKGDLADELGWKYLSQMFVKWFSASSNANPEDCESPFVVSFDWLLKYERAKKVYDEFVERKVKPGTIFSENAQKKIVEILNKKHGLFSPPYVRKDFDFITGIDDWRQWKENYFTQAVIGRPQTLDGLMAALAACAINALPKGWIEWDGSKWKVTLTAVGIYLCDRFNFDDDGIIGNSLEWWSKSLLKGPYPFCPHGYADQYEFLTNQNFNEYRNCTGKGGDFMVFSEPHLVEDFKEFSYDAEI